MAAGAILQKFINYRLRVALLGDITPPAGAKQRAARFRA
ncbi:TPA: DUF4180 domain-containing protein [Serratia marcescens]|uniref:DUF4180 domain-containing protein n=1 Tax=Serratia nevei TaxID=2703794 RepID=A0AAW6XAL2_9GAMM|nr:MULTISPECIES: DUF4180 domain-containing protein [Serratia]MDK4768440.1 DUF4180 domain-containing protein [Serratia nevei]MDK4772072.1 DUF4180 domain-containing protein [Serratia nevei]MDK4794909.1 DUF4180 domain-containing protein [Serratia nevei]MDK4800107.1 DUF4180 domain-containing protein [Serratia nevei]MDK4860398.1 DUF4180 domain-containing protein [Serratia nevei]